MWIVLLEAGFALFLLIFIVWWTMSGKKPDRPVRSNEVPSSPEDPPSNPNPPRD